VSRLLSAAFRALNESQRPGYWHDLATVATVLRESGDRGVESLLGSPQGDREAWDRLVAASEERANSDEPARLPRMLAAGRQAAIRGLLLTRVP